MQDSSKEAVKDFLRDKTFKTVLDVPSGGGWLLEALGDKAEVDGIDLYDDSAPGYRRFWKHDLDTGLPEDCGGYDLICCCEGIEHVGSPLLLLRDFHRALKDDGLLVVTTPNVWYPQARLQYWLRGFFPSFPPLADKVRPGAHMHITPWSFPQLYVFLKLAGFNTPEIVTEPMSRAKHLHEKIIGIPARMYCRGKLRKAKTAEEKDFWKGAASREALEGRHLIVVTTKADG